MQVLKFPLVSLFVRLEKVIKWKKMNGREKDLKDVEVAESYIRNKN